MDRPPGDTKDSATTPDERESPDMRTVMAERRRVIRGVLSGKLDLEAVRASNRSFWECNRKCVRRRLIRPHWVLAGGATLLFLRFGVRDPRENPGRRPKDRASRDNATSLL